MHRSIANNYRYSQLGELIHDAAEGIDEIVWRVDGKIAEIRRGTGDAFHLKFRYDAHGNRIAKHVFANDDTWKSSTYYVRDAQGNVLSTYTHTTEADTLEGVPVTLATYKQTERHIYGSSRLGMETSTVELIATSVLSPYWADASVFTTNADDRVYELTNHLGNVLATFTARKLPLTEADVVVGFAPHVTSLSDYYPFGSGMEGRGVHGSYRYGFNAMEREDDLYAPASAYDFGARMYDGRLGRWWSVDPETMKYPAFSNYCFVGNMPISAIDINGKDFVILVWQPSAGDQGHVAIAVQNTSVVGGKTVHLNTFTVYDARALNSNDIQTFIENPSGVFDGVVRIIAETSLQDLKNVKLQQKPTVLYQASSSPEQDLRAKKRLDGMVARSDDKGDQSPLIPYSVTFDYCSGAVSCAGLVTVVLFEEYGLGMVGLESIDTSGGVVRDVEGGKTQIPETHLVAATPNGMMRDFEAAIKSGASCVKKLAGVGNGNSSFLNNVTGGQLNDETPDR